MLYLRNLRHLRWVHVFIYLDRTLKAIIIQSLHKMNYCLVYLTNTHCIANNTQLQYVHKSTKNNYFYILREVKIDYLCDVLKFKEKLQIKVLFNCSHLPGFRRPNLGDPLVHRHRVPFRRRVALEKQRKALLGAGLHSPISSKPVRTITRY